FQYRATGVGVAGVAEPQRPVARRDERAAPIVVEGATIVDRPAHLGGKPVQPDRQLVTAEIVGPRPGDRAGGDMAETVRPGAIRKIHDAAGFGDELGGAAGCVTE